MKYSTLNRSKGHIRKSKIHCNKATAIPLALDGELR